MKWTIFYSKTQICNNDFNPRNSKNLTTKKPTTQNFFRGFGSYDFISTTKTQICKMAIPCSYTPFEMIPLMLQNCKLSLGLHI